MAGDVGSRQRARRTTAVACLVVVLAHGVALAMIARSADAQEPHQVPLLVAAPAVVASSLADDADTMAGAPFDATWTDDEDEARSAVHDGTAVAAVLVDLRTTRDVVLVNARADAALNDAVTDRLETISASRDRTFAVEELAVEDSDAAERVRWFVLLAGVLGLGVALVLSLVRGRAGGSDRSRLLPAVVALGGVAVTGAAVLQLAPATRLPGDDPAVIGIGALYVFTMGAVVLGAEALAGVVGLATATAAHFVLATPLLFATDPYLLPPSWAAATGWMPTSAAQGALAEVARVEPAARQHVLAITAAAAVALLVLALAHRMRERSREPGAAMPVRHWRLWVLGAVAPLAAVLGLVTAFVPTDVVGAASLPSVATRTTCVDRGVRPTTVAQLNAQVADLQGVPAFQGGDVGADVQLGDGRFLVVFGDTLRAPAFDGPRLVRNSMMLWQADCVSVVLPPSRGALIPDRRDGVGYWPMSTAVSHRPGYDLVLVSAQRVAATGAGSFDFANLGPSLAVFVVADGATPQLIEVEDIGPDDPRRSPPEWGAAMAVADRWLYLYGTANPDQEGVFGFSLRVARVRPNDVLDVSRWRFWDGSAWQRDAGEAARLIPAAGGVSQTLSVFRRGGRWYALSKLDGDLGDQLVLWTAPRPTGPFTRTAPVASLPVNPDSGAITYMPLAHPQLFPRPGTVVASYSNNNVDARRITEDPRLYRPTFLRVRLPG
ncbi:DUF4185 domain-containing protein [Nocardioides sp. zg-1228]|uniref:DUF4185 domain-containing protein n=1 Tax=Nocardioides sp. zg-1228 TaxID=2763008 RepID=UPI0016426B6A|nr:DUF4185 domain-containing protein [Nocardioides sp. zg-1228]MBC2931610.1 DUF4185 domain-containing protein [Nocardioides sp. zg-1228]QSF57203.1 DUF4185 domain-containing protein [Nocardioides sp. zg-1228]